MSTLYERIMEQTERLNITGNEFGALLGLKKSPLTDWKNKKSSPTLEQLIKICDIFAISADYLLYGTDDHLSIDHKELIATYDKLDRRGQHRVHTIIYEELDRMEKSKPPKSSPKKIVL